MKLDPPSRRRLLVDCTPLRAGGGVQVGAAFLDGLLGTEAWDWQALVSEQMLSLIPEKLRIASGARLRVVPKSGVLDMMRAGALLRRIEQEFRADVVFTIFGPAYFRARAPHLVGFALGTMLYDRLPSLPNQRWRERLVNIVRASLVRRASHLVVETETVKRRLAAYLRISASRISVIGNSVSPLLTRFQQQEKTTNERLILIPSSFYPHKNLEIIVPTLVALERLRPDSDYKIQLTLDLESPGWRLIRKHAQEAGVSHRLSTLGPLNPGALADAYSNASIVFLPTLCESSTAVYPEAFYFQRPLITSDLDFARELCGNAALFVPPLDPDAIASGIANLLDDPALVHRLTAAGEIQLSTGYPTPARKFAMQLALLERLATARSKSPADVL